MITLDQAYENLKKNLNTGKSSARPAVKNFSDILTEDSGPLYGFSHDIFHIKKIWLPDCARSGLNVLITGAPGTGKGLVAEGIHAFAQNNEQKNIPFVRVNCAALADEESGVGIFDNSENSWYAKAKGGFLFLDEISELDSHVLGRLMRVLEFSSNYDADFSSRTRIIAATNSPEKIRKDLFWRFQEHINLPSLAKRRLDVFFIIFGLLNNHKLLQKGGASEWLFTPATLLNILFSQWEGNVGELKNAIDIAAARYSKAPAGMPKFFTCRNTGTSVDVLNLPNSRYDLWRNLSISVRDTARGRELIPTEPLLRSEIKDFSVLRSLGEDKDVPCLTCAEALEFAAICYEQLSDDSESYEGAESRLYMLDTSLPPLPAIMRWRYGRFGNIRPDGEVGGIDFSGMSADSAYKAYLEALRDRCPTMSMACEISGISDTTLRRHFKDNNIRQYKGKRASKSL
ncbi:MAG: sigma 54-interacting transcriptional regulator [Planctomycetota bacterium]